MVVNSFPPNVIVFGETGVGKSSLLNQIAGAQKAEISSGAEGCTLDSTEYEIVIDRRTFRLFDTMGMNEPQLGKAGYLEAIEKCYRLVRSLEKSGGVQLLIFCMRGKITATVQSNWKLFNDIFCSRKVPVVLVVNGLEQEASMDSWWTENERFFKSAGIVPAGHACITSTLGLHDVYQKRYESSQMKLRHLILEFCGNSSPWKPEGRTWFVRIAKFLRTVTSRSPSHGELRAMLHKKLGLSKADATIIVHLFEQVDAEFTFHIPH